jgi:hypothetical protein
MTISTSCCEIPFDESGIRATIAGKFAKMAILPQKKSSSNAFRHCLCRLEW